VHIIKAGFELLQIQQTWCIHHI